MRICTIFRDGPIYNIGGLETSNTQITIQVHQFERIIAYQRKVDFACNRPGLGHLS